jgi:hypothetical protein
MRALLLLAVLLPSLALASRPRGERSENLEPPTEVEASPSGPGSLALTADLGLGSWSSSLSVVTSFEGSVGFGAHLTRHLLLSGELGLRLHGSPIGYPAVVVGLSAGAIVAWDVIELVRVLTERTLPFEAGLEAGLGLGVLFDSTYAFAPQLGWGGFARYVFSPRLSLGVRVRGLQPFWTAAPPSFHGGQRNGATSEPAGFMASLSLVRTF